MLILRQLLNKGLQISLGLVQNFFPGLTFCIAIDLLSWLID